MKNKMLYLTSVILASGVIASKSMAETISVEYKRFYSHVRKLDGSQTQALQFGFGFVHVENKALCKIDNAHIYTQKKTLPLEVTKENRFTVPSERALKLANAQVVVELDAPANQCDLSVQLETKPQYLKTRYSAAELQEIFKQYEAFFNEMGGILSFMMPKVTGLSLHFDDQYNNTVLANGSRVENGRLNLTPEIMGLSEQLTLPGKPLRVTAITE